jgi:hypothetical protein
MLFTVGALLAIGQHVVRLAIRPALNKSKGKAMGSWGAGSFQNDTAMDWLHKLYHSNDFSLVRRTLARVGIPPREFCQFVTDQETLAAAEIVACWLGHPSTDKDLVDWVRGHTDWFTHDLLVLAQKTVADIRTQSPLREINTNPDGTVRVDWLEAVGDLERRLHS